MKSNYKLHLLFITLFLFQLSITAQTKTWIGPVQGSWAVATNWLPAGVPGTFDDVLIPSGSEVNVDSGLMNSLTVETGAIVNKLGNNTMTSLASVVFATNSTFNFIKGTIVGTLIFNGVVNIIGTEQKLLANGIYTINDTMNIEQDVVLSMSNSAILQINSSATLTVADGGIVNTSFSSTLKNDGVIEKTSGTGIFTITTTFENNGGTMNINSGAMRLSRIATLTNGNYNVNANGFLEMDGNNAKRIDGTLTGQLDGPLVINSQMRLLGGENFFNFSGSAGVEWRGGTIVAVPTGNTLVNLGLITVTATGPAQTQIAVGAILRNEAEIVFNGSVNNFVLDSNSSINNTTTGIITLADGVSIVGGTFTNTGLVQKTTGTGVAIISPLDNNAPGVLLIDNGTVFIQSNNYTGDGLITGNGTMSTFFGAVIAGTIAPGTNGIGTLTYENNLGFDSTPDTVYQIEINGTTPNSQHDVLAIIGNANLNGILDIIMGFDGNIDDEFVIITANNITACNLPSQVTSTFNGNQYIYDVICNSTNVTLKVLAITLGIEDNTITKIKMYPNPTSGIIYVDMGQVYSETNITITNILGQVISKERFVNTNTINLNIDGSPGIYFATVTAFNEGSKTIKIIKK